DDLGGFAVADAEGPVLLQEVPARRARPANVTRPAGPRRHPAPRAQGAVLWSGLRTGLRWHRMGAPMGLICLRQQDSAIGGEPLSSARSATPGCSATQLGGQFVGASHR